MNENIVDLREFRRNVNSLLGGAYLSDKTILDRLADRNDEWFKAMEFRSQVKESLGFSSVSISTFNQGESIERDIISDDGAIAKIKELTDHSQMLNEIGDILRMANAECYDHRRFNEEYKILVTGFRRLCDIHSAFFKMRSEYEIYGSRIVDDALMTNQPSQSTNSVDLQAPKRAYDQEEDNRINKAERESFHTLRELYFAIAEMLGVNNDKDMIAKIKDLSAIGGLMANAYNPLKAEPIEDGAYFKIGNHHYTELVCFAARVRAALSSCGKFQSLSDDEAIAEIKRLQQVETGSKQSSQPYTVNVQITGDPTEIAEAIRDELGKAPRYDPQEVPEICDDSEREKPSKSFPDLEVENRQLKQQLSGIASFFGLPSDAKQPEICYAIMENRGDGKKALIERLHELIDRERIDSRNQISDLRHDLLVANKVIARLVGE
jgi:hypothetical protein